MSADLCLFIFKGAPSNTINFFNWDGESERALGFGLRSSPQTLLGGRSAGGAQA